jgi:hypothetical protein
MPELFGHNTIEDFLRPSPERFLGMIAPHRIGVLRRALSKIGFNFSGRFIADLTMPGNVGGYFSPDYNILAINPWVLLYSSEREIAHILFHEGLHAGIYTDGVNVMDETLVETLTKKKISEVYGGATFRSGYDGLVKEASEFFGKISFDEIVEKVEDGDEETFDNLLEIFVVRPMIGEKNIKDLTWTGVQRELSKKWKLLKKFFPRMINKIAKNNRGLHDEAGMEPYQYKLDGLLEKMASRIIGSNPEVILEIFLKITKKGEINLEEERMQNIFVKSGYRYIYDNEPEYIQQAISRFIIEVKLLKEQKGEINVKKLFLPVLEGENS